MSVVLMWQLFCHQQVEKAHHSSVPSGAAVVRLQSQSFTIIYLDRTWSRITSGHSYNVICFISCFLSSSITWYWRTYNPPILKKQYAQISEDKLHSNIELLDQNSSETCMDGMIKADIYYLRSQQGIKLPSPPINTQIPKQCKDFVLFYFWGVQLIECKKRTIYTN